MKTLDCIIGSVSAGCFSTIIGHPLDTIKVLKQTKPELSQSSFHVARYLAKGDPSRLFRGMGAPMTSQIVMNSVMFSVFNKIKDLTTHNLMLNENASALGAGLLSGFATACISTPTDWIKIQAQISLATGGQRKTDALSILKRLLKDNQYQGSKVIRVLYRGHLANLGREGVFTMVYLGLYDRLSNMIRAENSGDRQMGEVVIISSFTGACAWLCNYPFDTVKSVIQGRSTQSKTPAGYASEFRSIYKAGGIRGFYRGAGASTIRAMLVTSTRMLAYEKTLQLIT